MSPIASSPSDCVMVTISPAPIMILMICEAGTPSAAEMSLTVAPEAIVTGPTPDAARLSRVTRLLGRGRRRPASAAGPGAGAGRR